MGPGSSSSLRSVRVWEWAGKGLDQGDAAAEYLSHYFGKPVRLVRYAGMALPIMLETVDVETCISQFEVRMKYVA